MSWEQLTVTAEDGDEPNIALALAVADAALLGAGREVDPSTVRLVSLGRQGSRPGGFFVDIIVVYKTRAL